MRLHLEKLLCRYGVAALLALGLHPMAKATPPLLETLQVQAKTRPLFGVTEAMRAFPWSDLLRQIEPEGFRCSAHGAPVQKLALQGKQLMLIGFDRCGPDGVSLEQAYGAPGGPIPARWIRGKLWFPKGRWLSGNAYAKQIWQWHIQMEVKEGRVERSTTVDLRNSPLVPRGPKADRSWCLRPAPPPSAPPMPIQVIPAQR